MTRPTEDIRFVPTAGLKADLQALHDAAVQHPHGPEDKLLRVTLNQLADIKNGAHSTHPLEYMASYPDLSDCQTTYVSTDPTRKPSHRLVWREIPSTQPGAPVTREVIALGERNHGAVYHIAGARLGRPVGLTLAELRGTPEPVARQPIYAPSPNRVPQRDDEPSL